MKKIFLFFCLIFQLSFAQEDNQLFERIDFRAGILINSNRNLLHQYWKPEKGIFILANAPFYFGNIEAGMFFTPYKRISIKVPDYNNYFFFLGFSKEVQLPLNLSITSGVRFGSDFFSFSDDSLNSYESVESELAIDLFAAGKFNIYKGIHINAGVDYIGIITNRRIRLFFITGGVGYEFSAPEWLRELLR